MNQFDLATIREWLVSQGYSAEELDNVKPHVVVVNQDFLANALVEQMMKNAELEQRIAVLEGGTSNA